MTDQSLLIRLFRDPVLGRALLELQDLMPQIDSNTLNSMIRLKNVFESVPGAEVVLQKLLSLPLGLSLKMMDLGIDEEEMEALKGLGDALDKEKLKSLFEVVQVRY